MNINYQKYLERLDIELTEASDNRDAVPYFLKSNEAGIEPELLDLYEQGQAEVDHFHRKQGKLEESVSKTPKKRKRTVPDSVYKEFYKEAGYLSSNIGEDTDMKRHFLIKYFPMRFGDEGRNPVHDMNFLSVGNLFNNMVDYTQERIKQ